MDITPAMRLAFGRRALGGGIPDGLSVDAEDMLWVAQWGGSQVSRWNPRTGRLIDAISIPVPNVTCCAFGGEDLDDLYITTSSIGVSEQDRHACPQAGALFRVKPGVRGLPGYRFAG